MSFLYFLEDLRNPVLDFFFSFITLFGEETIFMAIGMIVFWCVDKFKGYYLLCVGFFGTILNQFLTKRKVKYAKKEVSQMDLGPGRARNCKQMKSDSLFLCR